jgi:hypothetical protein
MSSYCCRGCRTKSVIQKCCTRDGNRQLNKGHVQPHLIALLGSARFVSSVRFARDLQGLMPENALYEVMLVKYGGKLYFVKMKNCHHHLSF